MKWICQAATFITAIIGKKQFVKKNFVKLEIKNSQYQIEFHPDYFFSSFFYSRSKKKHKKFLPQVLKDDPEDHDHHSDLRQHHGGTAQSSSSNLINSDSATFAYPEINEPIRSSSPSYGALE